jgi:hypothetical protein
MTPTILITVNVVLGALTIAAVAALVRLAHSLPTSAPHSDEQWGTCGDPWVVSDPLPLRQLLRHEDERALARAA